MKSTPERAEALRYAARPGGPFVLNPDQQKLFNEMLSECEQELPKPLVFDPCSSSMWSSKRYMAVFSRDMSAADLEAIRAALTKAFPP